MFEQVTRHESDVRCFCVRAGRLAHRSVGCQASSASECERAGEVQTVPGVPPRVRMSPCSVDGRGQRFGSVSRSSLIILLMARRKAPRKTTNPASWLNVTVDTTPSVALNDTTLPSGKEIAASSPS